MPEFTIVGLLEATGEAVVSKREAAGWAEAARQETLLRAQTCHDYNFIAAVPLGAVVVGTYQSLPVDEPIEVPRKEMVDNQIFSVMGYIVPEGASLYSLEVRTSVMEACHWVQAAHTLERMLVAKNIDFVPLIVFAGKVEVYGTWQRVRAALEDAVRARGGTPPRAVAVGG